MINIANIIPFTLRNITKIGYKGHNFRKKKLTYTVCSNKHVPYLLELKCRKQRLLLQSCSASYTTNMYMYTNGKLVKLLLENIFL